MRANYSTQMVRFFTRHLPVAFAMFVHVSQRENFLPLNCGNFAVNATEILKFLRKRSKFGSFLNK